MDLGWYHKRMDTNTETQKGKVSQDSIGSGMVHIILSHSYTVFMLAVVFGLILDVVTRVYIFNNPLYQYIGLVCIVLGSAIIYWAQSTSNYTKEEMEKGHSARNFERGPYKFSRNPTHIGLSVMTLGLALILNSIFSVILTIIASIITKRIFLRKEEHLLEEKYGTPYLDYKKKVGTWI